MKRKRKYRLLYAEPSDAEFIDYLSECLRVDRKEVIKLGVSLLALLILAPDESYNLFSKVLERIRRRKNYMPGKIRKGFSEAGVLAKGLYTVDSKKARFTVFSRGFQHKKRGKLEGVKSSDIIGSYLYSAAKLDLQWSNYYL